MSKVKSIIIPIIVTFFLLLIWQNTYSGSVPRSFIKLDGIIQSYTIIYFIILAICLVGCRNLINRSTWMNVFFISLVGGYIISIIAYSAALLSIPSGWDRFLNSMRSETVLSFIYVQFIFPSVLFGWLYSLIGTILTKILLKLN